MTYIRHRDRMVQESVFEDLTNTLIACRWVPGTTTRPVVSPYDIPAGKQIVATTQDQVLKIVGANPVTLIDYFPESTSDDEGVAGEPASGHTPLNTLAIDDGQAGEPQLLELGSVMAEIPYRFSFAFWAANIGTAQALMNDLRDRYRGLIVNTDAVVLYDYNTDPDAPVTPMAVESFSYMRSADDQVASYEATLFYAQLTITDVVDDPRTQE
ncbi:MAG: hypothetical protein HOV97_05070 [Nonomuraea sp.]|nr:hypothetical protein [Nonomuraea sp.]